MERNGMEWNGMENLSSSAIGLANVIITLNEIDAYVDYEDVTMTTTMTMTMMTEKRRNEMMRDQPAGLDLRIVTVDVQLQNLHLESISVSAAGQRWACPINE